MAKKLSASATVQVCCAYDIETGQPCTRFATHIHPANDYSVCDAHGSPLTTSEILGSVETETRRVQVANLQAGLPVRGQNEMF